MLWRDVSFNPTIVEATDIDWLWVNLAKVANGFDRSRPLAPQIVQARRFLRLMQKQRCMQGSVSLETSQQQQREWCRYLRYLDAEAIKVFLQQITEVLQLEELAALRQQAYEMIHTGYQRILHLSNTTT